jgi:hypothetical protein
VAVLNLGPNQAARLVAAFMRRAREFREWADRPRRIELRGRKLLREWLSADQLRQYDEHEYFEVTGCHTGKRYRISLGTQRNVYQLDDLGRLRVGLCFAPRVSLVAGDVMLAQKIALENDERGVLAIANAFALTGFEQA